MKSDLDVASSANVRDFATALVLAGSIYVPSLRSRSRPDDFLEVGMWRALYKWKMWQLHLSANDEFCVDDWEINRAVLETRASILFRMVSCVAERGRGSSCFASTSYFDLNTDSFQDAAPVRHASDVLTQWVSGLYWGVLKLGPKHDSGIRTDSCQVACTSRRRPESQSCRKTSLSTFSPPKNLAVLEHGAPPQYVLSRFFNTIIIILNFILCGIGNVCNWLRQ